MRGAVALVVVLAAAVLLHTQTPRWISAGFARCVAAGYPPVKWPEDRWFNAIAAYEPSAVIAVGGTEGKVDLWSGCDAEAKHELEAAFRTLTNLEFSPGGRYLAGSSMFAGGIDIWDVAAVGSPDWGSLAPVRRSPKLRGLVP